MTIIDGTAEGKLRWNTFIADHYPAVGAFMMTWEWAEFQRALGRNVERYYVMSGDTPIAAFNLAHEQLPLGLTYGYTARGPLCTGDAQRQGKVGQILETIGRELRAKYPKMAFIRFEPPIGSGVLATSSSLQFPSTYIQPRFNHAVPLDGDIGVIRARFHPSTRSNLGRAEKRGVVVEVKERLSEDDFAAFFSMVDDTKRRNSGKNSYPSLHYFKTFVSSLKPLAESPDPLELGLRIYFGLRDEEPAGIHMVVFFNKTATYLFGTAFTRHLSSKIATYLHWQGIQDAAAHDMQYYDLGGIDEERWPNITDFKRQFRGEEFKYVGNIDAPLHPIKYRLFNMLRKVKRRS